MTRQNVVVDVEQSVVEEDVASERGSDAGTEPGSDGKIDDEERARRHHDLAELIELLRPAVQSDGGDLEVVEADVEAGTVQVRLQGACSTCAISTVTLQAGVDRILHERLPWVTEVTGDVDESIDPFTSAAMGRGAYVPRY